MVVFATTMDLRSGRIYPISEWRSTLQFLHGNQGSPQARENVSFVANHFGGNCAIDTQGRMPLPDRLREQLKLDNADVHLLYYKKRFNLYTDAAYKEQLEKAFGTLEANLAELEQLELP